MNQKNPDTEPQPPSARASIALKRTSITVIIISGIAALLVPITGYPLIIFGGVGYEPFPLRQLWWLMLLGGPLVAVTLLVAGWFTEPESDNAQSYEEGITPMGGLGSFWKALIIMMIFPGIPTVAVLLAFI